MSWSVEFIWIVLRIEKHNRTHLCWMNIIGSVGMNCVDRTPET